MCLIEINTQIRHKVYAIAPAKYYILRKQTAAAEPWKPGMGTCLQSHAWKAETATTNSDTVSEHE